jgi:hypothetical protein
MKRIKIGHFKFFALSFAVIILVFIIGCSGPSPTEAIINSFLANPPTIIEGESSTLSWSVTDATNVRIDHDIGSVDSTGNIAVNPIVTTIYTLTATNSAGSVTAKTIIAVTTKTTITLQPGSEGIDAGVSKRFPLAHFGSQYYSWSGNSADSISRTYIKFDLRTIPTNAKVIDAKLMLYQFYMGGSDNFTIGLYKVTSDWEESTIDWDTQPTCSCNVEALCDIIVSSNIWTSWDIDALVQGWLDESIDNYGMLLKDTDEASVNSFVTFYTSDYTTDASKRPKLEIDYYIP